MYKIISISFDLTIRFLMLALQIVFEDLKWSVVIIGLSSPITTNIY